MIRFLTTILENAAKELSLNNAIAVGKDIALWRERRHIASVGVTMFNLYVEAEEIVESGFALIPRIEFMARKHREQVFVSGYIAPTLEREAPLVKRLIHAQIKRVYAFADLQGDLRHSISLVDGDACQKLYSLSSGKAHILSALAWISQTRTYQGGEPGRHLHFSGTQDLVCW